MVFTMYATNSRVKIFWQKLIKLQREICKSTITVKDFNIPLSLTVTDSSSNQEINNNIVGWNSIMNQLVLINMYRILHQMGLHIPLKLIRNIHLKRPHSGP